MNIYEKLLTVQRELKAPKSQFNKFGGYAYRSAEDILEAAKPLMAKVGLLLTLTDRVIEIGGENYIESTVRAQDVEKMQDCILSSAIAREEKQKKGMDSMQISGAASSYARKYALGGLLAIDDCKDSDSLPPDDEGKRPQKQAVKTQPKPAPKADAVTRCEKCGRVIEPYDSNGKIISVGKHCTGSVNKFGKILCLECIKGMEKGGSGNA